MPSGLRSESRQGSGLLGDQLERPGQVSSKKHGSKQQKHHDIAEPVCAGYFSYAHEIVSAGERARECAWRARRVKGFSKVERACGVTKTPTAQHSGLRITDHRVQSRLADHKSTVHASGPADRTGLALDILRVLEVR